MKTVLSVCSYKIIMTFFYRLNIIKMILISRLKKNKKYLYILWYCLFIHKKILCFVKYYDKNFTVIILWIIWISDCNKLVYNHILLIQFIVVNNIVIIHVCKFILICLYRHIVHAIMITILFYVFIIIYLYRHNLLGAIFSVSNI